MHIGILTHPIETNYGGILQAYALQKILKDMGHDVVTIDRHQKAEYPSFLRHLSGYLKRVIYYYLLGKDLSTKWDPNLTNEQYKYITRNIQPFIDNNIRLTEKIYNSQLSEIDKYNFDAYIVGSDQVWLPDFCPNSFLDFVKRKNVIKVFYAASTGKDSWANNESLKRQCKELAQDFRAISVREENLIELCKSELGVNAQWVLDPTMLICKEEYQKIFNLKERNSNFLFSYILDQDETKQNIIKLVASHKNVDTRDGNVKSYCYYRTHNLDLDRHVFPSVESWLKGIYNADFVVTDSFHGAVFSILFNKQFVVIGNEKRGMDRFISLLKRFGLENRLIYNSDQLNVVNEKINFNNINFKLGQYRNKSIQFLITNLTA